MTPTDFEGNVVNARGGVLSNCTLPTMLLSTFRCRSFVAMFGLVYVAVVAIFLLLS
jgi:hypothetical protein